MTPWPRPPLRERPRDVRGALLEGVIKAAGATVLLTAAILVTLIALGVLK